MQPEGPGKTGSTAKTPPPRGHRGADFRRLSVPRRPETDALFDALVRNARSLAAGRIPSAGGSLIHSCSPVLHSDDAFRRSATRICERYHDHGRLHGTVTVAKAGLGSAAELADLNRQLIEDEGHPNPMTVAELTERMVNWLRGDYECYIARRDGRTLGYCVYRESPEYYYLRQLFVVRDYRRRGTATQLLDWMYAHVWAAKPVRLDVFTHNTDAVAFYRAYGFRVAVLRMEK